VGSISQELHIAGRRPRTSEKKRHRLRRGEIQLPRLDGFVKSTQKFFWSRSESAGKGLKFLKEEAGRCGGTTALRKGAKPKGPPGERSPFTFPHKF